MRKSLTSLVLLSMALMAAAAAQVPSEAPATKTVSSPPAKKTVAKPTAQSAQAAAQAAARSIAAESRTSGPPTKRTVRADRLDLETTIVSGNRELPKVLYIVPWKKADLGELPAQPFNTLLDEVLQPVDRDVFKREVKYFQAVAGGVGSGSSVPKPGAVPPPITTP